MGSGMLLQNENDLNMEGGAGQLNTCFSRELLEKSCIINEVGDIIIK